MGKLDEDKQNGASKRQKRIWQGILRS